MEEFNPNNPNDLKRLRSAAVGMIKDLVAARLIADPSWADKENVRQQWYPTTKVPQKRTPLYLLTEAAQGFEKFSSEFPGLDSVPAYPESESVSLIEDLRDLLCQFADAEELQFAASQLRKKRFAKTEWNALASWDLLPKLRALLDRLPASLNQLLTTEAPNVVYHGSMKIRGVRGQKWKLLDHLVAHEAFDEDNACFLEALAEPVWGDHAINVTPKKIDQLSSKTSKWLNFHQIPYRITRTGDCMWLEKVDLDSMP
jgi:hypothetical protein